VSDRVRQRALWREMVIVPVLVHGMTALDLRRLRWFHRNDRESYRYVRDTIAEEMGIDRHEIDDYIGLRHGPDCACWRCIGRTQLRVMRFAAERRVKMGWKPQEEDVMGTRADFYVGTGPEAEWLGSIAFDGYRIDDMQEKHADKNPDNAACWAIKTATTEGDYRAAVVTLLSINDDATTPDQGWPWPWEDSHTTDYAYAFVDGACKPFPWGRGAEWPNMKDRQKVTFGPRSGVLVFGAK
jgi:hypothetical protein